MALKFLSLQGALSSAHHVYPTGTWMRFPSDYDIDLNATELGATLCIKADICNMPETFGQMN